MTSLSSNPAPVTVRRPRAAATFGFALAAVGVPFAVGAAGAVASGWLAAELLPAIAVGFAAAALAVALGVWLSGRAQKGTALDADPRLAGQRLQILLGGSFVAKLAVLGLGFAVLTTLGLKFEFLIAFALAFAGAAVSLQLVTVVRLLQPASGSTRVPTGVPEADVSRPAHVSRS